MRGNFIMATKIGKNIISRGTTPLLKIKVAILEEITPSKIWITFSNAETGAEFFTVDEEDITIVETVYLQFRLTQEQTLLLSGERALWQLRIKDSNNLAYASRPDPFIIGNILKGGEI